MACTDPQCDSGIIPNPYADDPEDLTLCPTCNHGYNLREHYDYAGWRLPSPGASRGPGAEQQRLRPCPSRAR
ncbi:hypothetical protein [Streptomyces sp. NPDC002209]|uniref:hypothetical protein n=1 Tax=Streptomyces sp. NPDC002209 TaxID=3364638 RepID=UPI0036AD2D20